MQQQMCVCWCDANCNYATPFCPADLCFCEGSTRVPTPVPTTGPPTPVPATFIECSGNWAAFSSFDSTGCWGSGAAGSGKWSFERTGIMNPAFTKGSKISADFQISAYHGGRLEFRIMDIGSASDPTGSKWSTAPLLQVPSQPAPACTDPRINARGRQPCLPTWTLRVGRKQRQNLCPVSVACRPCGLLPWMRSKATQTLRETFVDFRAVLVTRRPMALVS
jgi:hypothetical protein